MTANLLGVLATLGSVRPGPSVSGRVPEGVSEQRCSKPAGTGGRAAITSNSRNIRPTRQTGRMAPSPLVDLMDLPCQRVAKYGHPGNNNEMPRGGRARRVGAMYALLALISALTALLLAWRYNLGVPATAISLIVTIPAGYLAWWAYKSDREDAVERLTIGEISDQLARALTRQWEKEAEFRRLNDPYPLPVSWRGVDSNLFDAWVELKGEARRWKTGVPHAEQSWATSPEGLSGRDSEFYSIFQRVPTRRLVVVGEPGAGKSVLLIRLLLDLLQRRGDGQPVPVLLSLASWQPQEETFHSWVINRLSLDHPALRLESEASSRKMPRVEALIAQRQLIFILDGLDELPSSLRTYAIESINQALRPSEQIVIACREEAYREAVFPRDHPPARLRSAAGVVLNDLRAIDVERYLLRDAGESSKQGSRWAQVLDAIEDAGPIAEALKTPLMVNLARTIYNPRLGETANQLPDPSELCEVNLDTKLKVEHHLFDAFLVAAYRQSPAHEGMPHWSFQRAERWLVGLAAELDGEKPVAYDLAWWKLSDLLPIGVTGVTIGFLPAIIVGIVTAGIPKLGVGLPLGIIAAMSTGLFVQYFSTLVALAQRVPAERVRALMLQIHRGSSTLGGLASGLLGGLLGGFAGGAVLHSLDPRAGAFGGLIGGLGAGLTVGPVAGSRGSFAGGISGGVCVSLFAGRGPGLPAGIVNFCAAWLAVGLIVELSGRRVPSKGLSRGGMHWSPRGILIGGAVSVAVELTVTLGLSGSASFAATAAVVAGLLCAIAFGLDGAPVDLDGAIGPRPSLKRDRAVFTVVGTAVGLGAGLVDFLAVDPLLGVAAALPIGAAGASLQAAWGRYTAARLWLALLGRLPWRLMTFLEDAHENRGILRQSGAVYQFRHAEFQHRLATKGATR